MATTLTPTLVAELEQETRSLTKLRQTILDSTADLHSRYALALRRGNTQPLINLHQKYLQNLTIWQKQYHSLSQHAEAEARASRWSVYFKQEVHALTLSMLIVAPALLYQAIVNINNDSVRESIVFVNTLFCSIALLLLLGGLAFAFLDALNPRYYVGDRAARTTLATYQRVFTSTGLALDDYESIISFTSDQLLRQLTITTTVDEPWAHERTAQTLDQLRDTWLDLEVHRQKYQESIDQLKDLALKALTKEHPSCSSASKTSSAPSTRS